MAERARRATWASIEELGELAYPGGGKEILQHLADARAGKMLKV